MVNDSPVAEVPEKWNVSWNTALWRLPDAPNHSVSFPVNAGTFGSGGPVTVHVSSVAVMLDGGYAVMVTCPVKVEVNQKFCALFTVTCSIPFPVPTTVTKSVARNEGHEAGSGDSGGESTSFTSVKCAVCEHGPGCVLPHASSGAVSARAAGTSPTSITTVAVAARTAMRLISFPIGFLPPHEVPSPRSLDRRHGRGVGRRDHPSPFAATSSADQELNLVLGPDRECLPTLGGSRSAANLGLALPVTNQRRGPARRSFWTARSGP